MSRMTVRLVISHALVAVIGALATFLIVRQLAPRLFDESFEHGGRMGPGSGPGSVPMRVQFADAVDRALLIGAGVGALAAAAFGIVAAYRFIRPLNRVREAARTMAGGRFDVPIALPREQELAELVTDVNSLGAELAETETRRTRLLGEVAHEMRTPLTVIDGTVEGMIDGVLDPSTERLGALSEETRRLRRLADDLSALSKAQEGRLALRLQQLDLGPAVVAATERLRPQAEDANLTLRMEGEEALTVEADPDRIAQVVTNLVGNAIRATPPGGCVTVTWGRVEGAAEVRVTDTGEGIAEQDLHRIFERFYRVTGRRTTGHDGGSGIGLTIARDIMRAHGGDLNARSPGRGRGSTFAARLPFPARGD